MEDLQVEDFNDPIEHKAEQTADGIKTPEKQESDEEQTSIFKEIMSWVIPFAIALVDVYKRQAMSSYRRHSPKTMIRRVPGCVCRRMS